MWAIVKDDPIHSAEANSQRLLPGLGAGVRNSCLVRWSLSLGLLISVTGLSLAAEPSTAAVSALPGLTYTNTRIAGVPLSIHVIRLQRADPEYQIQSIHALGEAVGLDTLSHQLGLVKPALGAVVAAINGDYYQREKSFAGAARGLQIMDGELLSGPSGEVSFWIDAVGEPHADIVASQFQITWPDGTVTAFGLNGERQAGGVELYTPAIGPSTHTTGGSEIILARSEGGPWLPLRIGRTYTARVQEIREAGDTPLATNIMVVSVGPGGLPQRQPRLQIGDSLRISTASRPALHGIRTAISGGPLLVRNGEQVRLKASDSESYQITSMQERHPRAAIGWNETFFFLVEVDGRQKHLSVGMTLDELAKFLAKLGCEEAMNFDGGGSATLWFDGQVRNSPCDRMEREIANCLVIVRKKR
jgi:hypothetical protein